MLLQYEQIEIVFPEVLAPMTHTVNFINDKSVNFVCLIKLVEYGNETWTLDNFLWRQVDEFVLALLDLTVD